MSSKKPVLVFCPGAWCKPGYFRLTTDILTKEGYTCLTVSLPGVDSELRPTDGTSVGLQTDADAVRGVIIPQLDAGNNVVAICHSYGGVVTSEAVKGLDRASRGPSAGAVIRLVYVAAIIMDVGNAVWPGGEPTSEGFIVDGDLAFRDPQAPGTELWLAGCTDEQKMILAANVGSHALKCFTDLSTYAAWRVISGTYVIGKKDLMPNMIAAAPEGHKFDEVLECDGDHFAFTSAAEQVSEAIRKAAEKAVSQAA